MRPGVRHVDHGESMAKNLTNNGINGVLSGTYSGENAISYAICYNKRSLNQPKMKDWPTKIESLST